MRNLQYSSIGLNFQHNCFKKCLCSTLTSTRSASRSSPPSSSRGTAHLDEGLRVLGVAADVVGQAGALFRVERLLPEGAYLAEVRVELVVPVGLAGHRRLAGRLLSARTLLRTAAREGYTVRDTPADRCGGGLYGQGHSCGPLWGNGYTVRDTPADRCGGGLYGQGHSCGPLRGRAIRSGTLLRTAVGDGLYGQGHSCGPLRGKGYTVRDTHVDRCGEGL